MAKKNKKSNMECGTMKDNAMDMAQNNGSNNNMMDDCGCGTKNCK